MNRDYLGMVKAIYAEASDQQSWVAQIAGAAQSCMDDGLGVVAYTYSISDSAELKITSIKSSSDAPSLFADRVTTVATCRPPSLVRRIYAQSRSVNLLSDLLAIPRGGFRDHATVRTHFPYGIADAIVIRGSDPPHRSGCLLTVPLAEARCLPPRTRSCLKRVAAHLGAGLRLRQALTLSANETADQADAVFLPNGNTEHLPASVQGGAARQALVNAVSRHNYLRSRQLDSARALELWTALVFGQWSIVDHLDRDGKRFILAHRNDPAISEPAALSGHERQVAAYAALGHSNKFIAYTLGLAPTTIASHLEAGLRKLRLRSRRELVQFFGPSR